MDYYIGTIMMFAGNYAPEGWALCNGAILNIAQNQALFAVIGNNYGGDGRTTFALPDLQDRVAVGVGQSSTTQGRTVLAEKKGSNTVTLTPNNIPSHTHELLVANQAANKGTPSPNSYLANTVTTPNVSVVDPSGGVQVSVQTPSMSFYEGAESTTSIKGIKQFPAGSTSPASIIQPSLGLNYIICTVGMFPVKP